MLPVMSGRPRQVIWAVSLELASLALGPVATALDWNHVTSLVPAERLIVFLVSGTLVVGYLVWQTSQGKNWARLTCLTFFLLGIPSFLIYLRPQFNRSAVLGVLVVSEFLLEGAAQWLLFIEPAKEWFTASTSKSKAAFTS